MFDGFSIAATDGYSRTARCRRQAPATTALIAANDLHCRRISSAMGSRRAVGLARKEPGAKQTNAWGSGQVQSFRALPPPSPDCLRAE
jgi:hypothetical protein